MERVQLNGADIEYDVRGSGASVVFIHGYQPTSSRVARSLGMNHAPFLGFAGIAGVLHPRARDGCGLCSMVAHALAHRPAVLRHRAFAMGLRRAHRVGAVATPQFICAFRLGRAWHTRTDRTTYESRGDRLLPPRA